MPHEFRVRWQREGRGQGTQVYQTWAAAYKRYCTVRCWDEVKEGTRYEDMPDLESVVLESREVPAWAPHDFQPDVSEGFRDRTREGILRGEPVPEPDGSGPFGF